MSYEEYDPFSVDDSKPVDSIWYKVPDEQPIKKRRSRFSDAQSNPVIENNNQFSNNYINTEVSFTSNLDEIANYASNSAPTDTQDPVSEENMAPEGAHDAIQFGIPLEEESVIADINKVLWDAIWVYVRKYLRPYLKRGNISSTEDCRRLGKKLTQKVYEKEISRGRDTLTNSGENRIKQYIITYFERHGYYSSAVNNNDNHKNDL